MNKNRKFKNFFIYPEFQFKLIFVIIGIALIAPLILLVFQYLSFREQIKNGQMMNLPDTHPYFVFYRQFQEQSLTLFGITMLVSFIICFILGIVISHRIAGPLIKLRKHFEQIALDEKNDKPISFRENDYFKELAESYNLKFKRPALWL